jgi:hypothetical protein
VTRPDRDQVRRAETGHHSVVHVREAVRSMPGLAVIRAESHADARPSGRTSEGSACGNGSTAHTAWTAGGPVRSDAVVDGVLGGDPGPC